jgi:hypothetical protein
VTPDKSRRPYYDWQPDDEDEPGWGDPDREAQMRPVPATTIAFWHGFVVGVFVVSAIAAVAAAIMALR